MQLTPDLLLKAYAIGIFPMAESRHDPELHWIDPEERGVLPFESFHIPRRLKRSLRRNLFEVRCDSAFAEVVKACAEVTGDRPDTWINPVIEQLIGELYRMGFAHSVECWRDGRLIGGLYGISLGGAFFGESMFSREKDASKVALVHLVLRLQKGGFGLLDTQFTTDHLSQFGVIDIHRDDYRERLSRAISLRAKFPRQALPAEEVEAFIKSTN